MLDDAAGAQLRRRLEESGFEIGGAPYARWAAKGPGVSVTHYVKGKLLVQGKGAADFAATYLDGMSGDEQIASGGGVGSDVVDAPIIGTDESGKGDYFGPLVTAGVLVRPEDVAVLRMRGVRDSKEVPDQEARDIADQIVEAYGDRVHVISIGPAKYNELHGKFGGNLNRLLAWAHGAVIAALLEKHECGRVLVDRFANEKLIQHELAKKEIVVRLEQKVRAESHPAVAAASIVARARFLEGLDRLSRDAGVKLRKGAGAPVDAVARELYRDGGIERLRPYAKLHFRTTDKARGLTR
jgi:ribonuclease HIII